MVKLIGFDTSKELEELTGLTHDELWDAGFNLDDWDAGFESEIQLHRTPTKEDIEEYGYSEDSLIVDWGMPLHWLMNQMENYCVGFDYTFYKGKHYYLVHHA